MKRRDLISGLAAAVLAGCNRGGKKRIAVIPKSTSHLFWVSVEAGARAAGKRFNVEILWNGPSSEIDFNRQVQIIDSMIAQRVDGIAVAAAERNAIIAPVNRAMAAGIPVTVFDSGLDSQNYTSFVATDNVLAGRIAARSLAAMLAAKGEIAIVLHAPGSVSTMDREHGFKEEIAANFPGIKIVAEQYGMSDRAKARAAAENILAAHPEIDGIFTSTEPSCTGTVLALKSRNLAGKVKLVTVDSSDNLLEEMRADNLHAIVAQDPFGMAIAAVETLVDKIAGRTPPKRIDLQPKLIHKDDLDKPEIRKLLKPDLSQS